MHGFCCLYIQATTGCLQSKWKIWGEKECVCVCKHFGNLRWCCKRVTLWGWRCVRWVSETLKCGVNGGLEILVVLGSGRLVLSISDSDLSCSQALPLLLEAGIWIDGEIFGVPEITVALPPLPRAPIQHVLPNPWPDRDDQCWPQPCHCYEHSYPFQPRDATDATTGILWPG